MTDEEVKVNVVAVFRQAIEKATSAHRRANIHHPSPELYKAYWTAALQEAGMGSLVARKPGRPRGTVRAKTL